MRNQKLQKGIKKPWVTALKVFCWCVGILAVLVGMAIWIISYYLSPERITRLIEDKSSEYLKADVRIGHLEYKLFRTYPWFEFEIDSLTIISRSLEDIPAAEKVALPLNSDSLAFIGKLKGAVNVHGLTHEDFRIRGIEIQQPKLNIVMVNDSMNNFNIVPSMPKIKKTPKVNISEISILPPIDLSFFSLQDTIEANAAVEYFYLTQNADKFYNIGFGGVIDGRYQDYSLPSKVPVKFNTGLRLDLPDFAVTLNDLSFGIAGLAFEAEGEVNANQKGIDIQQADFHVRIEDIFTLISYLPKQIMEKIPLPKGLSGILPLDITMNLLSPFHIEKDSINSLSLYDLPPVSSLIKVNEASLSFAPTGEKRVDADDIFFEAFCNFNPQNPEETNIRINELRMEGEGITMHGRAECDNLLGEAQDFQGDLFFSSPLMKSLSYLLPASGINISGILKGRVDFTGTALNLGKDGLKDLKLKGDLFSSSLNVKSSAIGNLKLKNLNSDYKAQLPSYPISNYSGTKMAFDFSADSVISRKSGMDILLSAIKLRLDALDTVSGTPDPDGSLSVKIGALKILEQATSFSAENLTMDASGSLNSGGSGSYPSSSTPAPVGDDALLQSRVAHTPLNLIYNGGGILQTLMNLLSLNAEITIETGNFKSPAYLYPVNFSRLNLSSNLNRVQFSAANIDLARTSCSVSGVMEGMRPFMTSYSATPLKATADIDFKNVDINQLSWGYYGAQIAEGENQDSVFFVPPMTPFTASDSTAVLIPRNIDATLRLRAGSAEYMQYTFSPLSTDIIVKDGAATLSKLTVGAPYCTAIVDWTYSTSHIDNIFMNLKADVKNFSFSPFYNVFPSLVEKSHELKNFTGVINADIGCYFRMFPNMFMNAESLKGDFSINGENMEFARQGKIERITHLMLIQGDEPIKIQNMEITGGFHDNLLQVNPFKISFDNYQLEVGGVNNTAGDMYYHLALEKSPFHLPFGVSLFGKFKHPEIKLGGTHINDYKSEVVSMNPDSKLNINIMAYLKHGWLLFVQEAAKYEGRLSNKE